MKPAMKDGICFNQSKGHNTKHSGVSCFSTRHCTNRQVSWISHNILYLHHILRQQPFHFSFHPHFTLTYFSPSIHFKFFLHFFLQPQNLLSVLHYPKISCGIKQQANLLMLHVIFGPNVCL